jgi:hypothetical protein
MQLFHDWSRSKMNQDLFAETGEAAPGQTGEHRGSDPEDERIDAGKRGKTMSWTEIIGERLQFFKMSASLSMKTMAIINENAGLLKT